MIERAACLPLPSGLWNHALTAEPVLRGTFYLGRVKGVVEGRNVMEVVSIRSRTLPFSPTTAETRRTFG